MKKFIIITSIFPPTEAIKKFSKIPGWNVVVVGDRKTPPDWNLQNVTYLSPEHQESHNFEIAKVLPWNHYCRKMIGYLYAMKNGAEVIYDSDDDNEPLSNWHEPNFEGEFKTLGGKPYVNIYNHFSDSKIWPRGFPLKKIADQKKAKEIRKNHAIGIWQFLANGDPDVDAIYRLTTKNPTITFRKGTPIVLEKDTMCPINSQNTFFHKKAFPLLYLPSLVTFRFTDILRGIIAQPILWSQELKTGFNTATVFQKRNEHDYLKDLESETPVHLHAERAAETAKKISDPNLNSHQNLFNVYSELSKIGIVPKKELCILRAWIKDVKNLTRE